MYVAHENRSQAINAVNKYKPKHFHIGRLCLLSIPIWLVLFMSAFILVSCGPTSSSNVNDIANKGTPTPNEGTPKPQAHASWQMQLETAQKEAAKIDPTAVIERVETSFTSAQLRGGKAWQTDFTFIRPNGVRIDVAVEDTSPPSVDYVVPAMDTQAVKPSQAELQRYASLISNVKIGPRELVQKTLDKNVSDLFEISVTMILNIDHQDDLGVANPWVVSYVNLDVNNSTHIFAAPDTGEIVKRYNYTLSTSTP